jgi:hypothetical protein
MVKFLIKKILKEVETIDLKPEITEFLLTNYPLIVGVSFSSPYVIGLFDFDEESGRRETIYRTSIYITLDPKKILDNENTEQKLLDRYDYDPKKYISDIRKSLKRYFNIDVFEYGSKWDLRGYVLDIKQI